MSIKVCDSIMGTGKSTAAINYMNSHKSDRFIYITPYLEEAKRIKDECHDLRFIEPSNKIKEYGFNKCTHTMQLIRKGRNISTTHQLFKNYTPEMLDLIQSQQYTLIIDESVDILETIDFHKEDLQDAVTLGYLNENHGVYSYSGKEYHGKCFSEVINFVKSRDIVSFDDNETGMFHFLMLPPALLTSFKDVFILTYLFEGQSLYQFFKIYNVGFEYIGVERTEDGCFHFGKRDGYVPEYTKDLRKLIDVLEHDRMNNIGCKSNALSKTWFDSMKAEDVKQLKNNISNYFNNIWRGHPAKQRLWGSYKKGQVKLKGKGYTDAFIPFNTKATNDFRDRDCLVYAANVYMHVGEKLFYRSLGAEVDEDKYALSVMIQWIWRSAIRDGKPIHIYIPSSRMRTLLLDWIDTVSKGGEANAAMPSMS